MSAIIRLRLASNAKFLRKHNTKLNFCRVPLANPVKEQRVLSQTIKCLFSSKKKDEGLESDGWIPPSHSPFNNNIIKELTQIKEEDTLEGMQSEYIDLDDIDFDLLMKAQQKETSDEDFIKELTQIKKEDTLEGMQSEYIDLDDIDFDLLMKAQQKVASDEDFMGGSIQVDDEMSEEEFKSLFEHIEKLDNEYGSNDSKSNIDMGDDLQSDEEDSEESLELQLQAIEKQMQETEDANDIDEFLESNTSNSPAWLRTRHKASLKQHPSATIEIIKHTLLTSDEIIGCLKALGGVDIKLIESKFTKENLYIDGMIIVTGSNTSHLRTMSNAIVKALKDRDLAEKDVLGAKYGAEDGDDWIAIDASNYLIHIMDEVVRRNVNLEKLWEDKEIDESRNLDYSNEDQMEDYVRDNPISSK